jgi:hypothetical protein
MLILITENILKAKQTNSNSFIFGFLIGLNGFVCARNFKEKNCMKLYDFFWDTSNSVASTFLGLDRSEKNMLGIFPSYFVRSFKNEVILHTQLQL